MAVKLILFVQFHIKCVSRNTNENQFVTQTPTVRLSQLSLPACRPLTRRHAPQLADPPDDSAQLAPTHSVNTMFITAASFFICSVSHTLCAHPRANYPHFYHHVICEAEV